MLNQPAITDRPIPCEISWARSSGLVDYEAATRHMARQVADIRNGLAAPEVWLLEHPRLFTAGTSARAADLFNPRGYPVHHAGRGGQWTYHGPGQRIAYVMLDLADPAPPLRARDVRAYVAALEAWIIAALGIMGIAAFIRDNRVGVWTCDPVTGADAKIAAIGVRISRWVSWHGVSINVDPDMTDFAGIVPCGLPEFGVTSIRAIAPQVTMDDLDAALATAWPACFGTIPALAPRSASQARSQAPFPGPAP